MVRSVLSLAGALASRARSGPHLPLCSRSLRLHHGSRHEAGAESSCQAIELAPRWPLWQNGKMELWCWYRSPEVRTAMSSTTATPQSPAIEYPDSDGEPMAENTLQFKWIVTIKEGLDGVFRHDPNVFVAGDLFWYPVEG